MRSELCELLNIKYPIMQGAFQWLATPELAAAVSNAGGLGTISASLYHSKEELLEAIGQMMDEKLDRKLQPIVDRLDKLEESSEEVRSGVNALLEWAEECGNVIKFPLPKVK